MRAILPLVLIVAFTLGATASARAQASLAPTGPQLMASAELRIGPAVPTAESARVGPIVDLPRHGARRTGAVLMIVGGAGIVTGLLVDEPIVTIAGAGVGGYGLYLYLK